MASSQSDANTTTFRLMIGAGTPKDAPPEMLDALDSVEVVHGATCPSGFRLSFQGSRYPAEPGPQPDYPLLSDGLLDPFNRVQIVTQPKGDAVSVLMDGFITHQEVTVEEDGRTLISVLGEDVSLKMDLVEVSTEFPNLTDSAIVSQILGNYSSLGIKPDVTAPSDESAPQDYVPQQNATDRYHLQMLAARHGFLFYVLPGDSVGTNVAYWGPPKTSGSSQKALTLNLGSANNLSRLNLRYEALAPTVAFGRVLDLGQTPAQVVDVGFGSANPAPSLVTTGALPSSGGSLASDPGGYASGISDLAVRGSLLLHPGDTTGEATSLGQGKVNRSVQEAAVAEGELDTSVYGDILMAPGLVDLRGVGTRFDGTWRVKQVRHDMSFGEGELTYLQKFVLVRGGTGSTISSVEDI